LRSTLGGRCVDLSEIQRKQERILATVAAMDAHAEVILGGQLPDDPSGGRTGKPDLLLCVADDPLVPPAYIPGDVKAHRTVKTVKNKSLRYSRPAAPAQAMTTPGLTEIVSDRLDDFIQLAHYARMLEASGYAPATGSRWGVIIGNDTMADLDPANVLVWHDLTEPLFQTFSRSKGKAKRSALERYDHEHGFRLQVARTAQARTGSAEDPEPLVLPVFQEECDSCPWHDYCLSELGEGVASVEITDGRLDVREWMALSRQGVHTTAELALVDLSEPAWETKYLPEVTHQPHALQRLRVATQRAQMICEGISLRRTTEGELDIPTADVEIDFDIEWDTDNRVYLWGALIRGAGEDGYHGFCSFEPMTDEAEVALAQRFLDWLRGHIANATSQGRTLAVFHYSFPEPAYLKKVLGEETVADVLPYLVDLLPLMRDNFLGAHGLSIKKVAPALGFEWRDDDPGGLQSQLWLELARTSDDHETAAQLQQRILDYNEDDVRATAAIRDGLRTSELGR
jgi:predicted RecB family nuclease